MMRAVSIVVTTLLLCAGGASAAPTEPGAPAAGPTTPPAFTRMYDGQCHALRIFVLAPPFVPSQEPAAAIESPCTNTIAFDPSSGMLAAASGQEISTYGISIFRPPYSSASKPSATFAPAGLIHPRQMAWDGEGNLWLADDTEAKVAEFKPPFTAASKPAAIARRGREPTGLAIDPQAGLMFVTDLGGGRMCKVTACRLYVVPRPYTGEPIATLSFPKSQPYALAVDRRGRLYVAIDESPTSGVIDVYRPPFSAGQQPVYVLHPGGPVRTLAFDPDGNLYGQLLSNGGIEEFKGPIDESRAAPSSVLGCPRVPKMCTSHDWGGLAFGP